MAKTATRSIELEPIDRLEEKIKLLVNMVDRMKAEQARAAEENEEIRWRNAEQEVRSAQSQWTRLGPVPPEVAGPMNERFQRACRKFYDSRRRAS